MKLRLVSNSAMVAALVIACWLVWTSPLAPLPAYAPAHQIAAQPQSSELPKSADTPASDSWSKALFHFPVDAAAPVAAPEPAPPQPVAVPPFKLLGLMETEEGRVALLDRGDGSKPVKVRESTMIDAWVVDGLARRAILLRRGDETLRLEIGRAAAPLDGFSASANDIGRQAPPARVIEIPLPPASGQ